MAPWVDVLSKIATVAVLGLAVLQFYETGRERQRERALQLVDQWVVAGNADRLARINAHLQAVAFAAQREIDALPEAMRSRAWDNATANMFQALAEPSDPATEAVRKDIDMLLQFFAQAEICVASKLCDTDVARAYFLVEARSIRTELAPMIANLREGGQKSYGVALDSFLTKVGP